MQHFTIAALIAALVSLSAGCGLTTTIGTTTYTWDINSLMTSKDWSKTITSAGVSTQYTWNFCQSVHSIAQCSHQGVCVHTGNNWYSGGTTDSLRASPLAIHSWPNQPFHYYSSTDGMTLTYSGGTPYGTYGSARKTDIHLLCSSTASFPTITAVEEQASIGYTIYMVTVAACPTASNSDAPQYEDKMWFYIRALIAISTTLAAIVVVLVIIGGLIFCITTICYIKRRRNYKAVMGNDPVSENRSGRQMLNTADMGNLNIRYRAPTAGSVDFALFLHGLLNPLSCILCCPQRYKDSMYAQVQENRVEFNRPVPLNPCSVMRALGWILSKFIPVPLATCLIPTKTITLPMCGSVSDDVSVLYFDKSAQHAERASCCYPTMTHCTTLPTCCNLFGTAVVIYSDGMLPCICRKWVMIEGLEDADTFVEQFNLARKARKCKSPSLQESSSALSSTSPSYGAIVDSSLPVTSYQTITTAAPTAVMMIDPVSVEQPALQVTLNIPPVIVSSDNDKNV